MTDMSYPEDIVNNMSLTELQNCDWDALFSQIEQSYISNNNNNYIHSENVCNMPNTCDSQKNYHLSPTIHGGKTILSRNHSKNVDKSQDIVISRKPIFIPLDKDNLGSIHKAIFLDSKFDFSEVSPKKVSKEPRGIYDCKICDEKFQTRASLITHVKVHQQPFCVLCLSPFKNLTGYNIHNSKLHSKQETDESSDSSDSEGNEEITDNSKTKSKHNFYDMYNNINTVTLTSKYGRRRKVLDMTAVINKKSRKSK